MEFWPGSAAVDDPAVEALDAAHQCQDIALRVEREFGFSICAGFAISDVHGPTIHFWNRRDDGALIDAARARRLALGYLGAVMSEAEVREMLSNLFGNGPAG
jgi:hypothetical protein